MRVSGLLINRVTINPYFSVNLSKATCDVRNTSVTWIISPLVGLSICVGLASEKDGRSSAMSEAEGLDEEDDDGDEDEEGGAETEEQSGNESEMNEQEEDVSTFSFL